MTGPREGRGAFQIPELEQSLGNSPVVPLQSPPLSVLLPHSNPKRWVVVNGGPEVCFGGVV